MEEDWSTLNLSMTQKISDLVIPALQKTWKVPYYFKEKKKRRGSGNMDQMSDLDTF